jgi:glycosyltransferase involved in cell wall biosynthesis
MNLDSEVNIANRRGITIFTPTINPIWKLERAYKSILQQSVQCIQWIVVSDASQHDVSSFLESKNSSLEIVYLHYEKRRGKNICYNRALQIAKYDFFCILDDDDEITPNALNELLDVWFEIPANYRHFFWGVAGRSFTPTSSDKEKDPLTVIDALNKKSAFTYTDSSYDEMKFILKENDEKFSICLTAVLKEFPDEDIYFHIAASVMWSRISRKYNMRYTNRYVRIYHVSDDGITNSKIDLLKLYQRTLGLIIWLADDLNINIKYFSRNRLHFLKLAANYVRYRTHASTQYHKQIVPENYEKYLAMYKDATKIHSPISKILIFLAWPVGKIYFRLDRLFR